MEGHHEITKKQPFGGSGAVGAGAYRVSSQPVLDLRAKRKHCDAFPLRGNSHGTCPFERKAAKGASSNGILNEEVDQT